MLLILDRVYYYGVIRIVNQNKNKQFLNLKKELKIKTMIHNL